jgi:glycosyltransferase involved in cell wall biosynthesis
MPTKLNSINSSPLVSVLLPVFNGGDFLLPAVQSIIFQTYKEWELILIDDGSTDDCILSIERLHHPQIFVYPNFNNIGLAPSLNRAINLASGKYFARMDADDLAFPDRLEKQVTFLEENLDIDLVASRVLCFSQKTNEVMGYLPFLESHEEISRWAFSGIHMPHPSWMGRSEWFLSNRYLIPEVVRAEDQELLLRALPSSRYAALPETLLAYSYNKPSLKRLFNTRYSLFRAQLGIFFSQRAWGSCLAASGCFASKVLLDFFRLVPTSFFLGCSNIKSGVILDDLSKFKDLIMTTKNEWVESK